MQASNLDIVKKLDQVTKYFILDTKIYHTQATKLKTQAKNSKLKHKTQDFGKFIWSSCRKQVQKIILT